MEISKEFAERQYHLHKSEADKWNKILKAFTNKQKAKLSKKEQELIVSQDIDDYHRRIRKRKTN